MKPPSRLLVTCGCGTCFEASSYDTEIVGAVTDHRQRCGCEIEWWLIMEDPPACATPWRLVSVGFTD